MNDNFTAFRGLNQEELDKFKKECDELGLNYGQALNEAIRLWLNRGDLMKKKKEKRINPLNRNQKNYNKYEVEEYMLGIENDNN